MPTSKPLQYAGSSSWRRWPSRWTFGIPRIARGRRGCWPISAIDHAGRARARCAISSKSTQSAACRRSRCAGRAGPRGRRGPRRVVERAREQRVVDAVRRDVGGGDTARLASASAWLIANVASTRSRSRRSAAAVALAVEVREQSTTRRRSSRRRAARRASRRSRRCSGRNVHRWKSRIPRRRRSARIVARRSCRLTARGGAVRQRQHERRHHPQVVLDVDRAARELGVACA